jgi:sigma-B regulation protein RsbU (phosphoserine phosphatase)
MDTRKIGANLAEGNRELLQTLGIEISTVLENARLLSESRRRHDLEQELQIAREIQQALLPATLPSSGWFAAAGSSEACFQVGGDYYDVIHLGDDTWGVVLADVSGKGVSAALMSSLLQGAFFAAAASSADLSVAVSKINRYITERSRHARFTTAFCALIHRDGKGRWVNAGHCAGIVVRAAGGIDWLRPTAVPIGLFPDAQFPSEQLRLNPGDRLVLYSDGVSEAVGSSADRFGEQRLADLAGRGQYGSVQELHDALMDEIAEFTQGVAQSDDLTLLVIGYESEKPA